MKEAIEEWVLKAEGDWRVANREIKADESPNYDAVCFHLQQCAEKYLKAYIISVGKSFPKTHDLELLLGLILDMQPDWEQFRDGFIDISDWAVEVRYPGLFADEEMAEESIRVVDEFRLAVRDALDLD